MPDGQDGLLLVELAQWATAIGLEDATVELFGEGFDPERRPSRAAARCEPSSSSERRSRRSPRTTSSARIWPSTDCGSRACGAGWRQRRFVSVSSSGCPGLYANFEALAGRQSG